MASGSTSNLGLSQWSAEDRVTREDFNADNLAIDAALAGIGNYQFESGSFVGDGVSSRVIELTFSGKPMVLFIGGIWTAFVARGTGGVSFSGNLTPTTFRPTWTDNSVYWTANMIKPFFNESGATYTYLALVAVDG